MNEASPSSNTWPSCLPADVAADDVVVGVVELGGEEGVRTGLRDVEGGGDVGQLRGLHRGIMPDAARRGSTPPPGQAR